MKKIIKVKDWLKTRSGAQFEPIGYSGPEMEIESVRRLKDDETFRRNSLMFSKGLTSLIIFKEFYSDKRRVKVDTVLSTVEPQEDGRYFKTYEVCIDDIEIGYHVVIKNGTLIKNEKTKESKIDIKK